MLQKILKLRENNFSACSEHLSIPSFKQDLLDFTDHETQLIQLGIEKSKSVIQIWFYFTLIRIRTTHGRLADLKLLTKRNVVLKLQTLRRLYKVTSCDCHLPFLTERCLQTTEATTTAVYSLDLPLTTTLCPAFKGWNRKNCIVVVGQYNQNR